MRRLVAGAVLSFVAASRRDYRLLINKVGAVREPPQPCHPQAPQRPGDE